MLQVKRSLLIFLWMSLLCGLLYPLAVTGIAKIFFPASSDGSLIKRGETLVGSHWIGQSFTRPEYFHSRPSATDSPYDAAGSSGSSLAPSNAKLALQTRERVDQVRRENHLAPDAMIPADLVLTSASGLDPHISPAAAFLQAERIATKRNLPLADVEALIRHYTEQPLLGIWGKARVHVLGLNLALDAMKTTNP